jgi:hypothetical protein
MGAKSKAHRTTAQTNGFQRGLYILYLTTPQEKEENTKIEQARNVMTNLLQKNAQMSKELSRTKLAKESQRLGSIAFERHGTTFVEVWQDGDAFHDLNKRRVSLLQIYLNITRTV